MFRRSAVLVSAAILWLASPCGWAGDPFAGGLGTIPTSLHSAPPAESAQADAETTTSPAAPAGSLDDPEASAFELTLEPAAAGQEPTTASAAASSRLVLQLKRRTTGAETDKLAQAFVIWSGPAGASTTIPLHWVDGETWASLIDLGPASGTRRLRLEALLESSSNQAQRLIETEYELTLPGRTLRRTATRALEEDLGAPSAGEPLLIGGGESLLGALDKKDETPRAPARSVAATWGMAFVIFLGLNVLLVGAPLGAALLIRQVPAAVRQKALGPLQKIFGRLSRRSTPAVQILVDHGLLSAAAAEAGRAVAVAAAQQIVDEASLERSEAPPEAEPEPVKRAPEAIAGRANTEKLIERLQAEADAVVSNPQLVPAGEDDDGNPVDLNDLTF